MYYKKIMTGIVVAFLLATITDASAQSVASFAFGRGKDAARASVGVQKALRELVPSTGSFKNTDLLKLLMPGSGSDRARSVEDALRLVEEGKVAYEQLDLELAQKSFQTALKKFEYGFGFLDRQAPLLECLMYLGATWVLVGEQAKAMQVFLRAQDLPGRKVLDPNLFPPNIQEVFKSAVQKAETGAQGQVTLLSAPMGAQIFIDGTYRGGTPLRSESLREGVHLVKALKDGYQPWGGKIKCVAGKKRNLKVRLKPTPRHRKFSRFFMSMVSEVLGGKPGAASSDLTAFLESERLAAVALKGSRNAMILTGYMCDTSGELACTEQQATLDTTGPDYDNQLKTFLRNLLTGEQTEGGEVDQGAAAAAALLAAGESGETGEGDNGFGLDLGAGKGEDSGETTSTGEDLAASMPDSTDDKEQEQTVAAIKEIEDSRDKTEAEKTVEETRPEGPEGEDDEGIVWYKEWWFWTAVGVVAAGAATGTYFLVSSGGSGGGNLVLDLH